jgi:hypothetical protein
VERLIIHYPAETAARVLDRVPSDRWLAAALFDLLFLQRDRHNENVFLSESGGMKLIDTRDGALSDVLDSVFFPRTYYYRRNAFGFDHMRNCSMVATHQHQSILRMDYRCHAPGGVLGSAWPPAFQHCLQRFAGASAEALSREFFGEEWARREHAPEAVPELRRAAARLRAQAELLLRHGFEGALLRTEHNNSTGMVPQATGFPIMPPRCAAIGVPGKSPKDARCAANR